MARNKDFSVYARLHVTAGITISAKDLTEAIEKAKNLGETDFITFNDEFIDGKMKIQGVNESHPGCDVIDK